MVHTKVFLPRLPAAAGLLAVAVLAVSTMAAPALAAQPKQVPQPEIKAVKQGTAVAAQDPDATGSVRQGGDANCARSRQRLFVEGEGWIVRRVTTCY